MGDTVETSLDWAGEYKGVFPCADCEGIETDLELKSNVLSSV
nr:copper resistance protein NlpE N-terminal domain-containing protein [Acinetobacter sp. ANC 5378]